MVPGIINGKDVLFLVNEGDGYVPFVCAKDLSIETVGANVPTATIGDGAWEKFAYQSLGYSITMNGVVTLDPTKFGTFDINKYLINFLELPFKILFVDQDDLYDKSIKGNALVERCAISANSGQLALGDISLKGNGAYQLIECDTVIENASIELLPGHNGTVTIEDVTGIASSFAYQLDNEIEQVANSDTFNLVGIKGGPHTLLITPICPSGGRGETYILDFQTASTSTDPTCGIPSGITFTNITDTSVKVNWTPGANNTGTTLWVKNNQTGFPQFFNNKTGSSFTIVNMVPDNEYNITVFGNCSGARTSSRFVGTVKTLTAVTPKMIIRNLAPGTTINKIEVNGIVVRSTDVEANTLVEETVIPGASIIQVFFTRTVTTDASCNIISSSDFQCNSLTSAPTQSITFSTTSIPTTGIELTVNPNLC